MLRLADRVLAAVLLVRGRLAARAYATDDPFFPSRSRGKPPDPLACPRRSRAGQAPQGPRRRRGNLAHDVPVHAGTRSFELASMTSISRRAPSCALEEGKFTSTTPVAWHLPRAPRRGTPITVRHLRRTVGLRSWVAVSRRCVAAPRMLSARRDVRRGDEGHFSFSAGERPSTATPATSCSA